MERDKVIAIGGNPNVGKSTVFNNLTKLHQHTGNWPGKTVTNASGYCRTNDYSYKMVDIPGTYSLMAHSAEEEIARDFICFGDADAIVLVCDGTCLERNLNLVLQAMEITDRIVVCVNLLDEAKRKGIYVSLDALSQRLGIPVIGMVARDKLGTDKLLETLDHMMELHGTKGMVVGEEAGDSQKPSILSGRGYVIEYCQPLERAVKTVEPAIQKIMEDAGAVLPHSGVHMNSRWLSLRLLDCDSTLKAGIRKYFQKDICEEGHVRAALFKAREVLKDNGLDKNNLEEEIVSSVINEAEKLCDGVVIHTKKEAHDKERRIDRILTSKGAGYPIMAGLLMTVLWITITGANYPSQILSQGLFWLQDRMTDLFRFLGAPSWLHGMLVLGVYRVLAWVVSVMLPPMAIFFPLFTLLEDAGYLPRIAYNLDKPFKKCCACGKQALTMCMECVYLQNECCIFGMLVR